MDVTMQNPSRITFTETERQLVRELVAPVINLLDSKKTDATSSHRKQEAWKRLAKEYNASVLTHNKATPLQLKRLWANMKARARDFRMRERQQNFTGGGPYVNVSDAESEQVLGVMPHIMTVIEVAQDSDTILEPGPSTRDRQGGVSATNEPGPSARGEISATYGNMLCAFL
ncbi:hypothetical protein EVAR_57011_1 [Eumeta japonica]|uniref:Regulatory protein zeste n=1 Tax=Eumeta variegata TaxID=151549 RepID=A0A4C1ZP65_EUMVA|nr:hypothetical protein EVAR_57011_1 [Eumeta japonica]